MQRKIIVSFIIIFFIIINLTYFWETKFGSISMPIFVILMGVFFVLVLVLLQQIILAIRENFRLSSRNSLIVFMAIILALIYCHPNGIIDFEQWEGKDVLIAQREGNANCMTTFKLKQNHNFVEKRVCFAFSKITGKYEIRNDTIFFSEVKIPQGKQPYYKYALITKSVDNKHILQQYPDSIDSGSYELWITKDEISQTSITSTP